jgi:sulfonate transport system ATP-binding protein
MLKINIKSKKYPAESRAGEHEAIADFKLSIMPGEFVCLVGSSGCGKTTLLNIIAGLDKSYEGRIDFSKHETPNIGYVFQNPRLLPWCTVKENIDLAINNESSSGHIDELLDIMQLRKFEQAYPERLSLGMSRRVAIIRAFAINPDVLLMDEPFVSLDASTARQIRQLLLNLWQKRPHTVVFVTHDLREAIVLADRIIFLSSPPMKVTHEIKVTIPRQERENNSFIETFRQKLIQDYPDLNLI